MVKIIAVANQKGGAAKTTTSINIAAGLARRGHQVLAIDADPQANLTATLLGSGAALGPRGDEFPMIAELLMGEMTADELIYEVDLSRSTSATYQSAETISLHVIPAHLDLAPKEELLLHKFQREQLLSRGLTAVSQNYDFIVIDCPPSLGILTVNALCAADGVWIPVPPGVYPMYGLGLLRGTIEQMRGINPKLRIDGVIPVITERTDISRDTVSELKQGFGDLVTNEVPKRVSVQESVANEEDIFAYDPRGQATAEFWKLILHIEGVYRG